MSTGDKKWKVKRKDGIEKEEWKRKKMGKYPIVFKE
jgi:hypothetical protein